MTAAWIATAACAAAVLALLVCEAKESRWRIAAKLAASACFVALPFAGGADLGSSYARLVVFGLVFGALGDAALLGEGRRALLVGLVLFLVGHLAYVAAFWPGAALGLGPLVVAAAFALIGVAGVAPRAGGLKVPVAAYSLVIAVMVATALGQDGGWLAPLGAVLFAASDLAVARQRFVKRSLANRLFGLPTYYAGQLLIAWSAVAATAG